MFNGSNKILILKKKEEQKGELDQSSLILKVLSWKSKHRNKPLGPYERLSLVTMQTIMCSILRKHGGSTVNTAVIVGRKVIRSLLRGRSGDA